MTDPHTHNWWLTVAGNFACDCGAGRWTTHETESPEENGSTK